MNKALLLTGLPGCGKTTLILNAVRRLEGKAGGFYTTEIREAGKRVGFEVVALGGARAVLSHVRISSPFRVGRYGVDVEALERVGVASLREAVRRGHYVVVDEIGKMELCSAAFRQAVLEALDGAEKVLGTIMLSHNPWADAMKKDARVRVVTVTGSNRQAVFQQVFDWVQGSNQGARE